MAKVHAWDEQNYILLTEGYLPDMARLRAALPRNPKFLRVEKLEAASLEEAAGRVLNALARRLAYFRRYDCGGLDNAMQLPLETWLIGPGTGAFSGWFAEEPAESLYRIFIHRQPLQFAGHEVPDLWNTTYKSLYCKDSLRLQHRAISRKLAASAKPLLNEMLQAYRVSVEAVQQVVNQAGHPYYFTGLGIR